MSGRALNYLRTRLLDGWPEVTPRQVSILRALADRHNAETGRMDPGLEQLRTDTRIHPSTISRELGALVSMGVLRQVRGGGRWSGKGYAFVGLDDGDEAAPEARPTLEGQGCKRRSGSTLDAANSATFDGPNSARVRNGMETEGSGDVRRRDVGGHEDPLVGGSSVSTSTVAAKLTRAGGNGQTRDFGTNRASDNGWALIGDVWERTTPYIAPDPSKNRRLPDGTLVDERGEPLPW